MIDRVEIGNATIINSDVIEGLRFLPADSVQCVVTSPPYWGLRDYGVEGMIGLESSFQEYLDKMVAVCEEIKRVLRSDGTFWLNIGDAYAGSWKAKSRYNIDGKYNLSHVACPEDLSGNIPIGFKAKDLLLMPARLAIALQESGWWVRSEIIWSKPNPMPESVTDRPTSAHEKIYLLTKSAKYYYDADAVREESYDSRVGSTQPAYNDKIVNDESAMSHATRIGLMREREYKSSRNLRNVWTIATQPYPEAHFATFPEALVQKCILAGTSEKGCCAECGKPWVRITEMEETNNMSKYPDSWDSGKGGHGTIHRNGRERGRKNTISIGKTIGFTQACECNSGDPIPCTVLDPFSGSGTTGLVALKLNRKYIGIELNPNYIELSIKRMESEALQEKLFR